MTTATATMAVMPGVTVAKTEIIYAQQDRATNTFLLTATQTIMTRLSITVPETQSESIGCSMIITVPIPSAQIILTGVMTP